jgi:enoyl-[acyl-carrier protein] reductase I
MAQGELDHFRLLTESEMMNMGLLDGKNALIFGVANERSIAWGITKAFHAQGARIGLSYAGEVLEKRVRTLAKEIDRWQLRLFSQALMAALL